LNLKPLADKLISTIEKIDGCEIVSGTGFQPVDPDLSIFQLQKLAGKMPAPLSLTNTVSFVVRGADSMVLLAGLDIEGICASSGSACSAGSLEPSHVIVAIGKRNLANSLVRFSLGRFSTAEEVYFVCDVLPKIIRRSQRAK
ncbi:MAG: aminotransferase class V-fold PLP-dependent enzyme, partial [Limisphaerales bacterium]